MDKEIKLYGSIGTGGINSFDFCNQLADLEKSGCKNLTIHMHCYGGSVFEGNVIYNAIKDSKMSIKIVIDGIAASMASILLLAVKDVEIAENGFVMVHRPTAPEIGDADAHLASAKLLQSMEANFINSISARAKLSDEEIKTMWFDGKDHWLNADESIKYGFAFRKVGAVAKELKTLDKGTFASMELKNIYDKYESSINNKNETGMKKELISLFELENLTEESSDTAVIDAIKTKYEHVKQGAESGKKQVENSVKQMVKAAQNAGKIPSNMVETYVKIGMTSGVEVLTSVLNGIKAPLSIMSQMKLELEGKTPEGKTKTDWTLEDYRMHAPNELRDNPKLYDELYDKAFGQK